MDVVATGNDTVRGVSLRMSLQNADEFEGTFESDLDSIVYNEGMTRSLGARSTSVLAFERSAAPTARRLCACVRGGTLPSASSS